MNRRNGLQLTYYPKTELAHLEKPQFSGLASKHDKIRCSKPLCGSCCAGDGAAQGSVCETPIGTAPRQAPIYRTLRDYSRVIGPDALVRHADFTSK